MRAQAYLVICLDLDTKWRNQNVFKAIQVWVGCSVFLPNLHRDMKNLYCLYYNEYSDNPTYTYNAHSTDKMLLLFLQRET